MHQDRIITPTLSGVRVAECYNFSTAPNEISVESVEMDNRDNRVNFYPCVGIPWNGKHDNEWLEEHFATFETV